MIGFIGGFAFSVGIGTDSTIAIQEIGYFVLALIFIGLLQWFENVSHKHHLAKWNNYFRQGKWKFIIIRYVLFRGVVLLLLFFYLIVKFHFTTESILVLILTAVVGLSIMAILGYKEWTNCQQHFEILILKETAQRTHNSNKNVK